MKTRPLVLMAVFSALCLCGISRGTPIEFTAVLSGAAESPPNDSAGTGTADVWYDSTTHWLQDNGSREGGSPEEDRRGDDH